MPISRAKLIIYEDCAEYLERVEDLHRLLRLAKFGDRPDEEIVSARR